MHDWQLTFTPELNIVTAVVVLTKAFVSGCPSRMLWMYHMSKHFLICGSVFLKRKCTLPAEEWREEPEISHDHSVWHAKLKNKRNVTTVNLHSHWVFIGMFCKIYILYQLFLLFFCVFLPYALSVQTWHVQDQDQTDWASVSAPVYYSKNN